MHPCFLHPVRYLLFIPVLLLLSPTWADATTYDVEFTFDGFSGDDLTVDGEASITDDGILWLTNYSGSGHAFYPNPLDFTSVVVANSSSVPSFSTTFVFAIVNQYRGLSSHGLAFVLSPTKVLDDFFYGHQYMGLPMGWDVENTPQWLVSSGHILAVELDTEWNPEVADIDSNHVGIDTTSLISNSSSSAGYYSSDDENFYDLELISTKPMQVWVDYDSKHTTLKVTMAPCSLSTTKPSTPLLSVVHDLSTFLEPKSVYAGFSSSTDTASKHYILGWSFKLNGEAAALNYSDLSLKAMAIQEPADQDQTHARPHSHNHRTIIFKVLSPIVAVSILVSAALFGVYLKRRFQARRAELEWQREYGPPSFTYRDLLAATSGFKEKMLLGRGGFGSVYRGVLPVSKQMVAIKRVSPESRQGMNEFMSEIVILGHLRHRNLVQLLGHCRHQQQLLLVYDYMPSGSLDSYLHTLHRNNTDLCWAQRFHIIKGIASGLFYLHEDWEQVVIHRDIKTSNVLLDSEMNARLGDFGLARSYDHGIDAHTTRLAGTYGYIAPELARLGKATKATDVFAFGVLMMEVVCARRPIWGNTVNGEPLTLADWVLTTWRARSITDAVDPRLDDYVEEEIELVLKLGLLCSHPSPNARPHMRLVMQYLERDASLPADLQPDTLLSWDEGQDEMHNQHDMSCPMTVITDLSNEGR